MNINLSIKILGAASFMGATACFGLDLVTLDYRPLQYKDGAGKVVGPIPKIVCEVLQNMKETCDVNLLPWPRSIRDVKSGDADGIFTAFKTKEREEFLYYTTEPLINQDIYLFGLTDRKIQIKPDFSNLKIFKIGTTSTISYGDKFDAMIKLHGLTVDRADDLPSSIRKLIAGRVDLFVSNRYAAEYALENPQFKNLVARVSEKIQTMPSYIAFSKKNSAGQALANKFDTSLLELKKNGRYQQILKEFDLSL